MEQTIGFSELVWNKQAISFPTMKRSLLLTQIQMEQIEEDKNIGTERVYRFYIGRSREAICDVRVEEHELNDLKMLQNFLLKCRFTQLNRYRR